MSKVTVTKFYAEWCQSCKLVSVILKKLKEDYKPEQVQFVDMNIDENKKLFDDMNIVTLPTVIISSEGKESETITGAKPRAVYASLIDKFLSD